MKIEEQLQRALAECERLRKENEQLKLQLNRLSVSMPATQTQGVSSKSSPEEKISLYMNLFKGREDVIAKRWETKEGRSGFTPACAKRVLKKGGFPFSVPSKQCAEPMPCFSKSLL